MILGNVKHFSHTFFSFIHIEVVKARPHWRDTEVGTGRDGNDTLLHCGQWVSTDRHDITVCRYSVDRLGRSGYRACSVDCIGTSAVFSIPWQQHCCLQKRRLFCFIYSMPMSRKNLLDSCFILYVGLTSLKLLVQSNPLLSTEISII